MILNEINANYIGDSITYGTYTGINDSFPASFVKDRWCDIVSRELEFKSYMNYAISGISISSTSSVNSQAAISKSYERMRDDAQLVVIAGGSNDFGTSVELGGRDDREDISFYGALNVLCRGLKKKYPHSVCVFITPINRSDIKVNKLGYTLDMYRNAIVAVAGEEYGFDIIDGSNAGFNVDDEDFINSYMRDRLHPNIEGHRIYADYVIGSLKNISSMR